MRARDVHPGRHEVLADGVWQPVLAVIDTVDDNKPDTRRVYIYAKTAEAGPQVIWAGPADSEVPARGRNPF